MVKVLLLVLSLTILKVSANPTACPSNTFVCQPCTNPATCSECFVNGVLPNYKVPCCQQLSQVTAQTAAALQGAAIAFAAAEASASAAVKVLVSATACASVSAYAAIAQGVSLSQSSGTCCGVSAEIAANASVYSAAVAQASAEAYAAADASASAQAAAYAAAQAGASALAVAQSIITSSCCGFNLEVYSAVQIVGAYVSQALSVVDILANVTASARAVVNATSNAAVLAVAGTKSILTAQLDNCCNKTRTSNIAATTANASASVCGSATILLGYAASSYEYIKAYGKNVDAFSIPLTLIDSICASECADVPLSCCSNTVSSGCCNNTANTVCLASTQIANVYLATKAVAETVAIATASAVAQVVTYGNAITKASAAAQVALQASLSVTVDVSNCCDIVVTVSTLGLASGTGVADAVSLAQAAASAYAASYSNSTAISKAVMEATAKANAAVLAYNNGCCGLICCNSVSYFVKSSAYDCCGLSLKATSSYSHSYYKLVSDARQQADALSKDFSQAAKSANANDYLVFSKAVGMKAQYAYQCCCCTVKTSSSSSTTQSPTTASSRYTRSSTPRYSKYYRY